MLNMFVAKNADGRLEVFVVVASPFGVMGHVWQKAPSNGWYQTWDSLAVNWDTHSELLQLRTKLLKKPRKTEIFVLGQDHNLYHLWQTTPNQGWYQSWQSLGGNWNSSAHVAVHQGMSR